MSCAVPKRFKRGFRKGSKELFFEEATDSDIAKEFIVWITKEWEAGAWILQSSPSLSGRGISWFKKCKLYRDPLLDWINEKKIVSKLQARGVKVDKGLIETIEKISTEPIEQKQKNSLPEEEDFPPRQLKNWDQVKFCVLKEKLCLEVNIDGKPFSESELTDRRLSKKNYSLLYKIVSKNGFFDNTSFPDETNFSQSVGRLNRALQSIFKISHRPISYNQDAKGYKTAFETEIDSSS